MKKSTFSFADKGKWPFTLEEKKIHFEFIFFLTPCRRFVVWEMVLASPVPHHLSCCPWQVQPAPFWKEPAATLLLGRRVCFWEAQGLSDPLRSACLGTDAVGLYLRYPASSSVCPLAVASLSLPSIRVFRRLLSSGCTGKILQQYFRALAVFCNVRRKLWRGRIISWRHALTCTTCAARDVSS